MAAQPLIDWLQGEGPLQEPVASQIREGIQDYLNGAGSLESCLKLPRVSRYKTLLRQRDAHLVTAAAGYIPPALIEQLKTGGRLVIPVGQPYSHQELILVEKDPQGEIHTRDILGVAFVPMVDTNPPAER